MAQSQILTTASQQAAAQNPSVSSPIIGSASNSGFWSSGTASTLVIVFAIVGGAIAVLTALFGANVLRVNK